jgi:hypothetical protein
VMYPMPISLIGEKLADHILTLHKDIHEVFILEEREGSYVVVGEASRKGLTLLAERLKLASDRGVSVPLIILGSATQFGGQEISLVGMEYEKVGLVLVRFDENRLLAFSTTPESLPDVMDATRAALPQLKQRAREIPTAVGAVTSAAQAENSARSFLAGRFARASAWILVDEVSYRRLDERWEVHGSYRSRIWSLSRRFQVEVDANDGSIKGFTCFPSSFLFLAGITCLSAAGLLAFLVFLIFFARVWG